MDKSRDISSQLPPNDLSPIKPHIEMILTPDGKIEETVVYGPNFEMRRLLSRSNLPINPDNQQNKIHK